MSRIFCLLFLLCVTISAQPKPYIYINGGKGANCSLSDGYDDLASAIQKSSTSYEKGIFWLVLGKSKEGKVVAQTVGIKGKTNKLEMTAINVAEKYEFKSDFDLLMLRVNSEAKAVHKVNKVKAVQTSANRKRKARR